MARLPVVSCADAVQALERAGWIVKRRRSIVEGDEFQTGINSTEILGIIGMW
jgi:hypothetical protein